MCFGFGFNAGKETPLLDIAFSLLQIDLNNGDICCCGPENRAHPKLAKQTVCCEGNTRTSFVVFLHGANSTSGLQVRQQRFLVHTLVVKATDIDWGDEKSGELHKEASTFAATRPRVNRKFK